MEKAYELKSLVEIAKSKGLELAEESAVLVFDSLLEWLNKSAAMTTSPVDDIVIKLVEQLEPVVKAQLDKINPEG